VQIEQTDACLFFDDELQTMQSDTDGKAAPRESMGKDPQHQNKEDNKEQHDKQRSANHTRKKTRY
jgi:hypothetical protein